MARAQESALLHQFRDGAIKGFMGQANLLGNGFEWRQVLQTSRTRFLMNADGGKHALSGRPDGPDFDGAA